MNKKILLILTLLFSLHSVGVLANTLEKEKPSNLSIEKKDSSYNITFKNPDSINKIKNPEDIKIELDVKAGKKDWTSKNNKVIVKNFVNVKGYTSVNLKKDEVIKILNENPDNYSIRARYSVKDQKSDFSNYVTMGSVGIYKNSSTWAEEELLEAQKLGLISDELKKDMKKNINREEFAELIVKAAEKGNIAKSHIEESEFKDTKNPYVSNAHSLKLMNGTGKDTFSPKAELTKQDMSVSVVRLISDTKDLQNKKVTIADEKDISSYAVESVKLLVGNNLLNLDKKNNFYPKKNVTREEAVITMLRAIK